MCGIFGINRRIAEEDMRYVLDLMAHRGPDGVGIWQDDKWEMSLGHRRLAILDLSEGGYQPCHHLLNWYSLTYNGELYNYVELREELKELGHIFKTKCDTEVVLAAYAEWGGEAFARFNGMWALAIWDRVERKLILSRDRFGQKPLYYIHSGDLFVFASEMKALVPFIKRVERSKKFAWMQSNLFDYEPTEHCLIEGIRRFPFGHWGVYDGESLKVIRYWDTLAYVRRPARRYRDQVEEFRELFLDACRIRMRSDVPIGTALSGGVDSSATLGCMAHIAQTETSGRFRRDWQHAFVASLPGTALDETYYAKSVTDHLGIDATFVKIDPVKGLERFEEYLYLFEELYITSPIPMVETYRAARENGVYVTLDGHGADELFAGYDTFLFHAFMDCGLNPLAIRNILRTYRDLVPPFEAFRRPAVGFENYLRWTTGWGHVGALKKVWKKEIRKVFDRKPHFGNSDRIESLDDLGELNKALYLLFHERNLPTLLRNYDRYSMMHGVEVRMPFLDHRIVSYCFSIPWTSKLRRGYTKTLVRDAMAPFVPKEVMYRKWKMGFQTPIVDWMKGAWKEYFLDIVGSQGFRESDLVDGDALGQELMRVIHSENTTYREGELAYSALQPYLWDKVVLGRLRGLRKIEV